MELLLPVERRLKSAALLREHMQQHRVIGGLEKLEGLDQQRQIVSVDRPEVLQAELLKQYSRATSMLLAASSARRTTFDRGLAAEASR